MQIDLDLLWPNLKIKNTESSLHSSLSVNNSQMTILRSSVYDGLSWYNFFNAHIGVILKCHWTTLMLCHVLLSILCFSVSNLSLNPTTLFCSETTKRHQCFGVEVKQNKLDIVDSRRQLKGTLQALIWRVWQNGFMWRAGELVLCYHVVLWVIFISFAPRSSSSGPWTHFLDPHQTWLLWSSFMVNPFILISKNWLTHLPTCSTHSEPNSAQYSVGSKSL